MATQHKKQARTHPVPSLIMSNEERAQRAVLALVENYPDGSSAPEIPVIDLLANLMHYCERNGLDFDRLLVTAKMHFGSEMKEALGLAKREGQDAAEHKALGHGKRPLERGVAFAGTPAEMVVRSGPPTPRPAFTHRELDEV